MTVDEKICASCGEWKPFDAFHRNRASRDGFARDCKPCRKRLDQNRASAYQEYRALYGLVRRDLARANLATTWREQRAHLAAAAATLADLIADGDRKAGPGTFPPGTRVVYIPGHAAGDPHHPDVEYGDVSSVNEAGTVFVKFDRNVQVLGWNGATAKGCNPGDLRAVADVRR